MVGKSKLRRCPKFKAPATSVFIIILLLAVVQLSHGMKANAASSPQYLKTAHFVLSPLPAETIKADTTPVVKNSPDPTIQQVTNFWYSYFSKPRYFVATSVYPPMSPSCISTHAVTSPGSSKPLLLIKFIKIMKSPISPESSDPNYLVLLKVAYTNNATPSFYQNWLYNVNVVNYIALGFNIPDPNLPPAYGRNHLWLSDISFGTLDATTDPNTLTYAQVTDRWSEASYSEADESCK